MISAARVLAILAMFGVSWCAPAHAEDYPARPIHLVVPFPPGGGTDIVGRLLAEEMQASLGQPVVIDNRTGASGRIGTGFVTRADPDGYTLLLATQTTQAVIPAIYKTALGYDPIKGFTPIGLVAETPLMLVVNAQLPVGSVGDLVAYIRKNAASVNYATSGSGSTPHMAGALFDEAMNLTVTQVPFRGEAPGVQELMAGRLTYMFCDIPVAMPFVKSGALKVLGVTSPAPTDLVPGVPTVASAGMPGFSAVTWFGVFGPPGLPAEVTQRINAALQKAAQSKPLAAKVAALGYDLKVDSPDDFSAFVKAEQAKWGDVVSKAGIKPE